MPYKIKKLGNGKFKVINKITGKTYSKHAQSKEMATRQLRALYANANDK